MLLVEYLFIICSMAIAQYCTHDLKNVTEIYRYQNTTNEKNASEKNIFRDLFNRRSVLIINSDSFLRSSGKKLKTTESLLYEEYGEDGKKMNSFMMYNLNDVSNFFKTYLNTEVCNVRCDEE